MNISAPILINHVCFVSTHSSYFPVRRMRAWIVFFSIVLQRNALLEACEPEHVKAMFAHSVVNYTNTSIVDPEPYYDYLDIKLLDSITVEGHADPFKFSGPQYFYVVLVKNTVFNSFIMLPKEQLYPDWCLDYIREIRIEENPILETIYLNFTKQFPNLHHIRIYNNQYLTKMEIKHLKTGVTLFMANNPDYRTDVAYILRFYYRRIRNRTVLHLPEIPEEFNGNVNAPYDFELDGLHASKVTQGGVTLLKRIEWMTFPGECMFFGRPLSKYELLLLKNCRKITGDLYVNQKIMPDKSLNKTDPELQEVLKKGHWLYLSAKGLQGTNASSLSGQLIASNYMSLFAYHKQNIKDEWPIRIIMASVKNLTEITGCLKIHNLPFPDFRFLEHLRIFCPKGRIEILYNSCQEYNNALVFKKWRNLRNGMPPDYTPPKFKPYPRLPLVYEGECICNITEQITSADELSKCDRIHGDLYFAKHTKGKFERPIQEIKGCLRMVDTMGIRNIDFLKHAKIDCESETGRVSVRGNRYVCESCEWMKFLRPDHLPVENFTIDCRFNCWCKRNRVDSLFQIANCKRLVGDVYMLGEIGDGSKEIEAYQWDNKFLGIDSLRGTLRIHKTNLTSIAFLHEYLQGLDDRRYDKYGILDISNNSKMCEPEIDMVLLDSIQMWSSDSDSDYKATIEFNCDCRIRGQITDFAQIEEILRECPKFYGNLVFASGIEIVNYNDSLRIPHVSGHIVIEDTALSNITFLEGVVAGEYAETLIIIRGNRNLCGNTSSLQKTFRHGLPNAKVKVIDEYNCGCYTFEELKYKECETWVGDIVLNETTDWEVYNIQNFTKKIKNILGCIRIRKVNATELPFLAQIVNLKCRDLDLYAIEISNNLYLNPIPWKLNVISDDQMKVMIVGNMFIGENVSMEAEKYLNLHGTEYFIQLRDKSQQGDTRIFPKRAGINESEWTNLDGDGFVQGDYVDNIPTGFRKSWLHKEDHTAKKKKEKEEKEEAIRTTSIVLGVLGGVALILIVCGIVAAVIIVKRRRNKKKEKNKKKNQGENQPLLPQNSPNAGQPVENAENPSPAPVQEEDGYEVVAPSGDNSKMSPSPAVPEAPTTQKQDVSRLNKTTSNDDVKMQKTNLGKSRTGTISKDCSKENMKLTGQSKEQMKMTKSDDNLNAADANKPIGAGASKEMLAVDNTKSKSE